MRNIKRPRRLATLKTLNAWMIVCISAGCILAVLALVQAYQNYAG